MKYLPEIAQFLVHCGAHKYRIRFADPTRIQGGDCQSPYTKSGTSRKKKVIRISWKLLRRDVRSQKRLLNIAVHEATHACGWHLSEETVEDIGNAAEEILWKLGYRRVVGPDIDSEYPDGLQSGTPEEKESNT